MRFRPFAEFASDLPTDLIENEDGTDFVQYGGKSVAEAIREMLARLGCEVGPLLCAGEHGWEFRFRFRKLKKLWCQVTLIEGYLAIFKDHSARWRVFSSDHPDFMEILVRLNDEMSADRRFHEIGWFAPEEVLTHVEGAASPVGDFSNRPCMRAQPS